MSNPVTDLQTQSQRPMRADARRNYEKLVAAARDVFTERGSAASLEVVAERAGVGIGTLYRHFPNRQALLEALYVDEVEDICRVAVELDGDDLDPWDALSSWFDHFIGYMATKQALAGELLNYLDKDAPLFASSRAMLFEAGEPLIKRAQAAGVVRPDVGVADVIQMVVGIAKIPTSEPGQSQHMVRIALDGLRYRPSDQSASPA